MNGGDIEFLKKKWTEHALLIKTYTVGISNTGKGIWRANPNLVKNQLYDQELNTEFTRYVETKLNPLLLVQQKWDLIKNMVKKVTQNFSRSHTKWREVKIRDLQSEKRNRTIRLYRDNKSCFNLLLPVIKQQLGDLQN